ncbi:MAG: phenylalanine--tRNA ligase subunit alpha, partial [Gemmatimonadota bacterium]
MSPVGTSLLDRLAEIEEQGLAAIEGAEDAAALEAARIAYLGRNGRLADAIGRIGSVEPERRRDVGQRANAVKEALG